MASAGGLDNSPEQSRQTTEVIEATGPVVSAEAISIEEIPESRGRLEEVASEIGGTAGKVVSTVKDSASELYGAAREGARAGYSQLAQKTQEVLMTTKAGARRARREYPLETLGVLAGIGFLVGIALRIWRAHEPRNV
jgi:ElaB/YqjD/DUF883 family membrane-anchored ribosome-binding protein